MGTLHDTDFYGWALEQAERLRHAAATRPNDPSGLDWEHLAEEVWGLGLSLENELYHRYVVLLAHLLKWQFQPRGRGGSWRGSIKEQRHRIARLLRKNPALRRARESEFADAYAEARERALDESGMPDEALPAACPYTSEQAEDPAFWPGPPPTNY